MDIHYAESAILTPSDFAFARDGVAADTAPNTETIAIADLSLADLLTSRQSGAVQHLRDRRFDLYRVDWKDPAPPGIGSRGIFASPPPAASLDRGVGRPRGELIASQPCDDLGKRMAQRRRTEGVTDQAQNNAPKTGTAW